MKPEQSAQFAQNSTPGAATWPTARELVAEGMAELVADAWRRSTTTEGESPMAITHQSADPERVNTSAFNMYRREDLAIASVSIPDLWHIAQHFRADDREKILSVWHLCHDLRDKLLLMAAAAVE